MHYRLIGTFIATRPQNGMPVEKFLEYPTTRRLSIFKTKCFYMIMPSKVFLISEVHTCNFRVHFLLLPTQICLPYFFAWYSVTDNIHAEQIVILFSNVFFQSCYLTGSSRKKYTFLSIEICFDTFKCIT